MIPPQIPANESQRLAALHALGVLDTPAEARFDRITRLVARLLNVPIAVISLVDANREWFKSTYGFNLREAARDTSFCGYAILGEEVLLIPDTRQDPRFAGNPQVTGPMKICFYAGCPLRAADGSAIGALSVKDRRPRKLTGDQMQLLKDIAAWVESELACRQTGNGAASQQAQEPSDIVKELQEANERLKAANVLKDDFVAKVSHELRTPLTSVKEGLSLLLDNALGPITKEQDDFLKTMDSEIDRLTDLINNMLDIAKIESGRMRLVRRAVDLKELIDTLIRGYQAMAGHRTIRAAVNSSALVFADANRMHQVFTNLLSNALKFTSDNGTINFRIKQREDQIVATVEDNGAGIAKEDLPKLFKKFSQVSRSGPQQAGGTGLGLAVCKELVELHRGTISVVSQLGEGTVFTVALPAYTEELACQEAVEELSHSEGGKEQQVGLLAIRVPDKERHPAAPALDAQQLDAFADAVRLHVHRDDSVLSKSPYWVLVLAAVGLDGIRAIAQRLKEELPGGDRLIMGAALHLGGAVDAERLFALAASVQGIQLVKP